MSQPLFVRENSILALGASETQVDYDYLAGLELRIYQPKEGEEAETVVVDHKGASRLKVRVSKKDGRVVAAIDGAHKVGYVRAKPLCRHAKTRRLRCLMGAVIRFSLCLSTFPINS